MEIDSVESDPDICDPPGVPRNDESRIDNGTDSGVRVVEKSPMGRFIRFNRRLGTGSFKVVYLAFDNDTGREVAWNVVSFVRLGTYERKRIDAEIKLAATLDHPRILKFVSAWINRDKGDVVFITERVSGGSLRSYIRRLDGPLKVKVVRTWCLQILEGLVYLHTLKPNPVIHRDLKCDNIFVHGNEGNVVIGDLGLCTTLMIKPATSLVGTPEFMAPELYDEKYGTAVDMYAFGMCLLEMVSRKLPFCECQTAGQIYKKVIMGEKPADVGRIKNPTLRAIVEACLQPIPQDRPTAVQLLKHSFWTSPDGGDELADLTPSPASTASSTPHVPSTLVDEPGASSVISVAGSEELAAQPWTKSETVQLPTPPPPPMEEELQSIQRKQSVSIGGSSGSVASLDEDELFALSRSSYEEPKPQAALTRENLSTLPQTAQVEAACRLLHIKQIPQVSLFIQQPNGYLQRVSFDYTLELDSPTAIAGQLVEAGLAAPPVEAVTEQVNQALLSRVQEIAAGQRLALEEPTTDDIPTICSHVSTGPPPSL